MMSNFVLEAVLDHALEDMGGATTSRSASAARSASVDSMLSPTGDSSTSMR